MVVVTSQEVLVITLMVQLEGAGKEEMRPGRERYEVAKEIFDFLTN